MSFTLGRLRASCMVVFSFAASQGAAAIDEPLEARLEAAAVDVGP